jgi:hypothetical protein
MFSGIMLAQMPLPMKILLPPFLNGISYNRSRQDQAHFIQVNDVKNPK